MCTLQNQTFCRIWFVFELCVCVLKTQLRKIKWKRTNDSVTMHMRKRYMDDLIENAVSLQKFWIRNVTLFCQNYNQANV